MDKKDRIKRFFNKEAEINNKISELEAIMNSTKDEVVRMDSVRALLEELKQELIDTHYDANTDDLTGFLNKKNIELVFDKLFSQAKKSGLCVSLFLIDIDYLKLYNDAFGHIAGTKLISDIAKAITKSIRHSDIAVRYGGDEFLLLCIHAGKVGASNIKERIKENIAKIKTEDNSKVSLSIAFDTCCGENIKDFEEMFIVADKRLYEIKDKHHLKNK